MTDHYPKGASVRLILTLIGIGSLALSVAGTPALAQPQSPAQANCLTQLSKGVAKLVRAQGADIDACADDLARSGGNIFACYTSDSKGKIAKAAEKLADTATKSCGEIPDFGYAGAAELAAAAMAHRIALVETTTSIEYIDEASADCARLFLKGASKLLSRKLRAFTDCLDDGLSAGSIQSTTDVVACFATFDAASDPRLDKVANALADKMARRHCAETPFACTEGVADCVARSTTCRACETLRLGGNLAVDCALQHDGNEDFFCGDTCGDGELAGLELCDDGNRVSGDGCDANCTPSQCGNGLATSGEFCEGTYANIVGGICIGGAYDGFPCAWNDECTGGYCTSCPNRYTCEADCSACGIPNCFFIGLNTCALYEGACIGQGCPPAVPCDDPACGTEGNCRFDGYCVPTSPESCAEYEGVVGNCVLGF